MNREDIIRMAREQGLPETDTEGVFIVNTDDLGRILSAEREAIYNLVMEAPFKEFDRQEEEFDGEAANAMKAMAFSLTSAIRARGDKHD